ncbi:putative exported protein [Escherichia coli DEC15C]|nr:putative exported protein [Escherichia coli DEC15C]
MYQMNKLNKNKWRTNVCVRIFKIILPATILISATTANAAVCSPDVSSSLKQAQYNAMKQDAAQLEPVAKNFMDNINQSLETIGCTDAWPTGNLGISLPSVDSIIKKRRKQQ